VGPWTCSGRRSRVPVCEGDATIAGPGQPERHQNTPSRGRCKLFAVTPDLRREFLKRCLSTELAGDGGFSAFSAGVRDARRMTGRDESTGKPGTSYRPESWLGTLGYMAVLDHVGDTLKPRRQPTLPMKGIKRALGYFANDLAEDHIWALYALRCSFAHDYGLINRPTKADMSDPKRRAKMTHWFTVTDSPSRPLVTIPSPRWNGKFLKDRVKNERSWTWVNLPKFGDRTEGIIKDLQMRADAGMLTLTIPFDSYQRRYAMGIRPDLSPGSSPTPS
jgi:hypothetical protein